MRKVDENSACDCCCGSTSEPLENSSEKEEEDRGRESACEGSEDREETADDEGAAASSLIGECSTADLPGAEADEECGEGEADGACARREISCDLREGGGVHVRCQGRDRIVQSDRDEERPGDCAAEDAAALLILERIWAVHTSIVTPLLKLFSSRFAVIQGEIIHCVGCATCRVQACM